jgi:hypothetical protein
MRIDGGRSMKLKGFSPVGQARSASVDCDCCWLLKETQGVKHRFKGKKNVFISLDGAWSDHCSFQQSRKQDPHECLEECQALVQVLDHCGADIRSARPAGPHIASVIAGVRSDWPAKNAPHPIVTGRATRPGHRRRENQGDCRRVFETVRCEKARRSVD